MRKKERVGRIFRGLRKTNFHFKRGGSEKAEKEEVQKLIPLKKRKQEERRGKKCESEKKKRRKLKLSKGMLKAPDLETKRCRKKRG